MHARELEVVPDPSTVPARQGTAMVLAAGPKSWTLEEQGVSFQARRAASCLLEPGAGDTVWFVAEGERRYVLAVLERGAEAGEAQLSVEGDATLRVDGQLSVQASTGLELHSEQQIGLSSDELRVQARLGRVVFQECTAILRTLFSHVTNSTFVAKVIETVTNRLTISAKTSYRNVAEIDQVQAGTIDYRAKDMAHLASNKTMINGGEIVKVEAGQIHLG